MAQLNFLKFPRIGTECLRETAENALYSVHKVKQGGLLYIFYMRHTSNDYFRIIRWAYSQKKLSYSDFSHIKEGTSIDDAKKVDPTTQIFENIYNANPDYWKEQGGLMAWHYLSDGILELGYMIEDDKAVLRYQQFIEDFQISQNDSERSYPYDGHILPMDMIK